MRLSDREICYQLCGLLDAECYESDTCCDLMSARTLCEAQHKADLEDFQKQKQEMWSQLIVELAFYLAMSDQEIEEELKDLKHKWGIE